MSDGWDKNEKYVLEKIETHDDAANKQAEINHTQSSWNHKTDTRIDKIEDRQTKITIAIAALTAAVVQNGEQAFKFIVGLFKP